MDGERLGVVAGRAGPKPACRCGARCRTALDGVESAADSSGARRGGMGGGGRVCGRAWAQGLQRRARLRPPALRRLRAASARLRLARRRRRRRGRRGRRVSAAPVAVAVGGGGRRGRESLVGTRAPVADGGLRRCGCKPVRTQRLCSGVRPANMGCVAADCDSDR